MNDQRTAILGMKHALFDVAQSLSLPVRNAEGRIIGALVPIGPWIEAEEQKIRNISTWRNAAKKMFPTQIETTYDSTLAYLTKSSIENESGLLFAIYDELGVFVGHIGITNVQADQVELAHLIKGIEGSDPKLIFHSEVCLIDWCFRNLKAERVTVEIMSYNWIVSMMHYEIGFELYATHPLKKSVGESGITHQVVAAQDANVKYTIAELRLEKDRFNQYLQRLNYQNV